MSADCPTPQKLPLRNMNAARKVAIRRAREAFISERPFESTYAYRCQCGMVHLTSRKSWDGRKHPLMARIRPAQMLIRESLLRVLS